MEVEKTKQIIFNLLHYGQILTDENIQTKTGHWFRFKNIEYDGEIWYVLTVDGKINKLKKIGKTA